MRYQDATLTSCPGLKRKRHFRETVLHSATESAQLLTITTAPPKKTRTRMISKYFATE